MQHTYFDYVPVEKYWEFQVPRHCLEVECLPYTSGAISMLGDIHVLVQPIPFIWGLNIKMSRKLRVLSVFGLGMLYNTRAST